MTARLSKERFKAAQAFVEKVGRPLDREVLRHRLAGGPGDGVIAAVRRYQNFDGGFGHGLEPDIRSPASSAIATSLGLRRLAGAGADATHPAVVGAMRWLGTSIDEEQGVWPIIGPDVSLGPHAPWWSWSPSLAEAWNGFRFNPTAEILARLYAWPDAAPPAALAAAESGLRRTVAETDLITGAYDLKCAVRLAEAAGSPADLREPLARLVERSIAAHDPDDPHGSVLDFVRSPASRFAKAAGRGVVEAAIRRLIAA